ncbi:MAG TPA: hypothetical protein VFF12_14890, partial [Myxococcaceae bacterium]|nr:hypothetical protein [Myxococcaceae bacterium]
PCEGGRLAKAAASSISALLNRSSTPRLKATRLGACTAHSAMSGSNEPTAGFNAPKSGTRVALPSSGEAP